MKRLGLLLIGSLLACDSGGGSGETDGTTAASGSTSDTSSNGDSTGGGSSTDPPSTSGTSTPPTTTSTTSNTTSDDESSDSGNETTTGGEDGLCLACDCHDLYGDEVTVSCDNSLNPTGAGQHQWGSSYADWTPQTMGVEFSQRIRILQPAYESFHTHTFALSDASGGYIGLQTRQIADDGTIGSQIRFSIWDTLEADGPNCITFGGEGIGYTCFLEPFPIAMGSFYTVTVRRGETEDDGTWWEGSVTHDETCETTVLGRIKVAHEGTERLIRSAGNFSEYFGPRAQDCMSVPQSIVEWTAPIIIGEDGVATQDPLLAFSKAEPDATCEEAGVEASGETDEIDGTTVYRMTNGSIPMCG